MVFDSGHILSPNPELLQRQAHTFQPSTLHGTPEVQSSLPLVSWQIRRRRLDAVTNRPSVVGKELPQISRPRHLDGSTANPWDLEV